MTPTHQPLTCRGARAEPLPVVTLLSAGPAVVFTIDRVVDGDMLRLLLPDEPFVPVGESGGPDSFGLVVIDTFGRGEDGTFTVELPAGSSLATGDQLLVEFFNIDEGADFLAFEPASDGIPFFLVDGSVISNVAAVAAFDFVSGAQFSRCRRVRSRTRPSRRAVVAAPPLSGQRAAPCIEPARTFCTRVVSFGGKRRPTVHAVLFGWLKRMVCNREIARLRFRQVALVQPMRRGNSTQEQHTHPPCCGCVANRGHHAATVPLCPVTTHTRLCSASRTVRLCVAVLLALTELAKPVEMPRLCCNTHPPLTCRGACAATLPVLTLLSAGPTITLSLDPVVDGDGLQLLVPSEPLAAVGQTGPTGTVEVVVVARFAGPSDGGIFTLAPGDIPADVVTGDQLLVEFLNIVGYDFDFLAFEPASDEVPFFLVDGSVPNIRSDNPLAAFTFDNGA